MGSLLSWIVFGLIVGLIARFIAPGHQHLGLAGTTLLGIGGSFMGGFLSALIWGGNWRNPSPTSWIGAIVGAIVLLVLFEKLSRR
jgi:uncharacterized membrane protein YeaQ/YmgE (transglycosylase-associated protein family)